MSSTVKWTLRIFVPVVLVGIVCGLGETIVQAQDPALRFLRAAPFPQPEEELYGASVDGKMYVIGGFGARGAPPPAMVYEYDPNDDVWAEKSPIPVPVHHQMQTELNGKIYVFGGCQRPLSGPGANGWQPVDNAWEYDPVADSWNALAPMPGSRCAGIAEVVDGKIYVIGGVAIMENSGETALFSDRPSRVVGTNQVYDPVANTWADLSPMPTTRNHAFSGAVDGKIYVIGGRQGSGHITVSSNTDIVEEYDPALDLWGAVKSPMPTPRSGGGAATYDGRIFVGGGEYQSPTYSAGFKALEAYDVAANQWIVLPSMPTARHGVAIAFVGNRIHFVSGKAEGGGLPDLAGKATAAHDVLEIPASFGLYY